MLVIQLKNIQNLNTSLQVGDMIYATQTTSLLDGSNRKGTDINASDRVGFLRKIEQNSPTDYALHVDDSGFTATVSGPPNPSFIMFSKHNQSDGDIKGYYMEVKFINDSKQKAELFSVSSEVSESSK